ncbi:alpha-ketoglutarate-dependent dioxygenase AlkB family protein [Lutimonas sp.]|uniref:alpha-ketoglutarate-dependent dioxygenase AlkB family protein n=1 Tax=Lutimonas sp. TaxID=1872403 RepID=UPI003D9ADB58
MQLSFDAFDNSNNLLPYNGELMYVDNCLGADKANYFFEKLLNGIHWEHDEFHMYGKKVISKRKVAWYGTKNFDYGYSGIHRKARPWNKDLLELKTIVEDESQDTYNACLLNLYHSGLEGMGWHSDNEKELKSGATIASISLGSPRKFSFKHIKTKETVSLTLQHGSLLLMKGSIQQHWLHQLPKTKKSNSPRINLTFRTILEKSGD